MKIQLKQIKIKDLIKGYKNELDEGVVGYNGLLDIRPAYQREFRYNEKQQKAVIETIRKGFPLNVMYWVEKENGQYELLDGQQRTLSICSYLSGDFSVNISNNTFYFHNLTEEEQEQILNYEIMVYFCSEGSDREKLDWFNIINIAGEKLTNQELLNSVFTGKWLSDAKKHFSKPNCLAYQVGKDYISGVPIKQEFLETALDWISDGNIEEYMAKNHHLPNASPLIQYFQSVIHWIEANFRNYRKEMKGLNWGILYNEHKDKFLDHEEVEKETQKLIQDDDVTKKKGIYEYILTRNPKHLSIRSFTDSQKTKAYERQKGICPSCGEHFTIEQMEGDHITPWTEGGKTVDENLQMLCKECNRRKGKK